MTPSDCSMPKRVISKNERSWPTSVMSVPCSVVMSLGGVCAQHLLGEEARDGVGDRVVDVEAGRACGRGATSAILAARARSCGGYSNRRRSRRPPRGSGCSRGSRPGGTAAGTTRSGSECPRRAELLAELGGDGARSAHGRVAGDADVHSGSPWCPRAQRIDARAERRRRPPRPWRATRPIQPSPRSWKRAAGQQRVARAPQAVGARLVALLERARRLLLQRLHLVQGPAARRSSAAARRVGSSAPSALLHPRHLALRMASRARVKAASTSGWASPRPAREHGLGVGLQVGQAEALRLQRARLRGLDQRDARAAAASDRPRDAEVRVRGADLRVVGDLRRPAHVGERWAAAGPGSAGAAGRRGSSRPAIALQHRAAPPRAGSASQAAHLDAAVAHRQRAALAVHQQEQVEEARRAPAPAGDSRPPAGARRLPSAEARGRRAAPAAPAPARAAISVFRAGSEGSSTTRPGTARRRGGRRPRTARRPGDSTRATRSTTASRCRPGGQRARAAPRRAR